METIERVLFNPSNGKMAVGIRLRFIDKYQDEPIANLPGYAVRLEPDKCDAWAIDNEDGIWLVVTPEALAGIEDWGPL